MLMGNGATWMITATFGIRMSRPTGFHIATETGFISRTTAGRGLATSRGVGLHITTAAGCMRAARGDGGRDQCIRITGRSGRRRMSRSGDGAAALDLELVSVDGAASDGCRWGRVTGSIRGGGDITGALDGSATEGTDMGVTADSHRFTAECDSRT